MGSIKKSRFGHVTVALEQLLEAFVVQCSHWQRQVTVHVRIVQIQQTARIVRYNPWDNWVLRQIIETPIRHTEDGRPGNQ